MPRGPLGARCTEAAFQASHSSQMPKYPRSPGHPGPLLGCSSRAEAWAVPGGSEPASLSLQVVVPREHSLTSSPLQAGCQGFTCEVVSYDNLEAVTQVDNF